MERLQIDMAAFPKANLQHTAELQKYYNASLRLELDHRT
jgi:hypothetical protein